MCDNDRPPGPYMKVGVADELVCDSGADVWWIGGVALEVMVDFLLVLVQNFQEAVLQLIKAE